MSATHWEQLLPSGLPVERESEVRIRVHAGLDPSQVTVVTTRINAILQALRQSSEPGEPDPLVTEDKHDLLRLLDHLHRVIMALRAQEDRVITALRENDTAIAPIAGAMEASTSTVHNRIRRIALAAEQGMSAAGLDEADL